LEQNRGNTVAFLSPRKIPLYQPYPQVLIMAIFKNTLQQERRSKFRKGPENLGEKKMNPSCGWFQGLRN